MSGSGKHTVFKALEDLGYFCVDNLPTALIPRLIQMTAASGGEIRKLAIVVDVRLRESVAEFKKLFRKLKRAHLKSTIIFVDAADEILARRYSETRRIHPLAKNRSLFQGVRSERRKLSAIRTLADLVIDTSNYTVHDLRKFIYETFQQPGQAEQLQLSIVSFGYKYGIPHNSDLVFDVRFLVNPNFVPGLKEKTGCDPEVVRYLLKRRETVETIAKISEMLEYLLPKYAREGKSYLTVSVGCTGGKHRSVMVAGALKEKLVKAGYQVNLIHRDLH